VLPAVEKTKFELPMEPVPGLKRALLRKIRFAVPSIQMPRLLSTAEFPSIRLPAMLAWTPAPVTVFFPLSVQ
jgi:hypothetical protein